MAYEMITTRQVRDSRTVVEIRPDEDGVGYIKLTMWEDAGSPPVMMPMHPDEARLVAKALMACAEELDAAERAGKIARS